MEKQTIKVEVERQAYALTNVIFQHSDEQFGLLCVSGHTGRQYLASPAHAKRIWMRLGEHLKAYEAKNGEIAPHPGTKTPPKEGNDSAGGGSIEF